MKLDKGKAGELRSPAGGWHPPGTALIRQKSKIFATFLKGKALGSQKWLSNFFAFSY